MEKQLTPLQQDALARIIALLQIEAESGTITKKSRNYIMRGLDPHDLAAISTEIIKYKQSVPAPQRFTGNNSGGAR